MIVAVDPGTTHSAFVSYNGSNIVSHGKVENGELLGKLRNRPREPERGFSAAQTLVVEMIASYGMPVGREVFETCVWIGRFVEAWRGHHAFIYRKDVKLHLCGLARAKDGNVRQALIDKFSIGGPAIGVKSSPGPLYGVSGDVWQALGVAVTFCELRGSPTQGESWPGN